MSTPLCEVPHRAPNPEVNRPSRGLDELRGAGRGLPRGGRVGDLARLRERRGVRGRPGRRRGRRPGRRSWRRRGRPRRRRGRRCRRGQRQVGLRLAGRGVHVGEQRVARGGDRAGGDGGDGEAAGQRRPGPRRAARVVADRAGTGPGRDAGRRPAGTGEPVSPTGRAAAASPGGPAGGRGRGGLRELGGPERRSAREAGSAAEQPRGPDRRPRARACRTGEQAESRGCCTGGAGRGGRGRAGGAVTRQDHPSAEVGAGRGRRGVGAPDGSSGSIREPFVTAP